MNQVHTPPRATPARGHPAAAIGVLLRHPLAVPTVYLAAIAAAEYVTAVVNVRLGLPLHALILFALLVHAAQIGDDRKRALLWGLCLAPLIRILSLSLPVARFPVVYWYFIISVPVFASTIVAARTLGLRPRQLGLFFRARQVPGYLLMLGVGLVLGIVEYRILQPQPLAPDLAPGDIWIPALILTLSTGFEEELIFRGLLQQVAGRLLGTMTGILYVSALFAVLHIGYLSVIDLFFVFCVGLFFALVALRTRSILGPTLAHAGVNVGMFLVWPFLLPNLPLFFLR